MGVLTEQYKNHAVHQDIKNNLEIIANAKNNENYNEEQQESLLAFEQLFIYLYSINIK